MDSPVAHRAAGSSAPCDLRKAALRANGSFGHASRHVYVKRPGYEVPQRVWTTTDAKPGSWAGVMTCSRASDWTVNSVVTMLSKSTA
jgi:hypothetical protein